MFNSRTPAPNSLLLSRKECRSCVVFLMQDHSSRRVYACLAFPYPNKSRQTTTAACREGSAGRKIALGHRVGQDFFLNKTATLEISTLSLHDALPIVLVSPT